MKHLDNKFQDLVWIENGIFLLEHSIIDGFQIQEVVYKAKHKHDLKLNHFQEVLDSLFVLRLETELGQ